MNWAAFLDRDGVLNDYVGLVSRPDQLRIFPQAPAAVKALRGAGAKVIVITNQPVVARGLVDEAGLGLIHKKLEDAFAAEGAPLDAVFYCPHHPEKGHEANDPRYRRDCECRKPKTGMILEAKARFDLDLARSFFVGDTTRDTQTARNAGCRSILVRTGLGGSDKLFEAQPDAVCDDVAAAAAWIVARAAAGARPA